MRRWKVYHILLDALPSPVRVLFAREKAGHERNIEWEEMDRLIERGRGL